MGEENECSVCAVQGILKQDANLCIIETNRNSNVYCKHGEEGGKHSLILIKRFNDVDECEDYIENASVSRLVDYVPEDKQKKFTCDGCSHLYNANKEGTILDIKGHAYCSQECKSQSEILCICGSRAGYYGISVGVKNKRFIASALREFHEPWISERDNFSIPCCSIDCAHHVSRIDYRFESLKLLQKQEADFYCASLANSILIMFIIIMSSFLGDWSLWLLLPFGILQILLYFCCFLVAKTIKSELRDISIVK